MVNYDITESYLIQMILLGKTISQIAEENNISVSLVRKRMKSFKLDKLSSLKSDLEEMIEWCSKRYSKKEHFEEKMTELREYCGILLQMYLKHQLSFKSIRINEKYVGCYLSNAIEELFIKNYNKINKVFTVPINSEAK